jgi:ribosomal protein S3
MKRIIKYIVRKEKDKHQTRMFKNYTRWRFLVSLVEDKDKLRDVIKMMASWFAEVDKSGLALIWVVDFFVFDDALYIVTSRPGLIIGKGGKDIDSLMEITGMKVKLIEAGDNIHITSLQRHVGSLLDYV